MGWAVATTVSYYSLGVEARPLVVTALCWLGGAVLCAAGIAAPWVYQHASTVDLRASKEALTPKRPVDFIECRVVAVNVVEGGLCVILEMRSTALGVATLAVGLRVTAHQGASLLRATDAGNTVEGQIAFGQPLTLETRVEEAEAGKALHLVVRANVRFVGSDAPYPFVATVMAPSSPS